MDINDVKSRIVSIFEHGSNEQATVESRVIEKGKRVPRHSGKNCDGRVGTRASDAFRTHSGRARPGLTG